MRKIYTSVDLGSDSIKIMVGEIFNKKLNVLATSSFKSRGIKKGLIVNASEVLGSLKGAISEIEKKIGVTIDKVIASVPSYYSSFEIVNAEIDVDEEDFRISGKDIVNVLKESIKDKIKKERELVTIIPIFLVFFIFTTNFILLYNNISL